MLLKLSPKGDNPTPQNGKLLNNIMYKKNVPMPTKLATAQKTSSV